MTRTAIPASGTGPAPAPEPGQVLAGAALLGTAATVPVLARMRRELLTDGRLSAVTTAAMYTAYTGHAAATAIALTGAAHRPGAPRALRWGGAALAATGSGLTVAAMRRFAGPAQISGTDPATMVATGIYHYSRNPQYLGYLATLTGLALARRSPAALALTGAAAAAYRWWIPIEEQHLARTFGAPYRAYRARTRRWLGRRRTKR